MPTATSTKHHFPRSILLLLAAMAVFAGACSSGTELGDTVASTSGDRPELVLEAALSSGSDPFTDSSSTLDDSDVAAAGTVEHDAVDFADDTAATEDAVAAVAGGAPGLYGGTGDDRTCDPAAISAHLATDPAKAAAWAEAQGIGVHGIDAFLDTLTPLVLLHDTRVTNHGYRDGNATPFQSALQAGTAVLVDTEGVPRVRCACGNPLDEPVLTAGPAPGGTPWAGYGTTPVVTVVPAGPVNVFVVVNIHTGDTYEVPAGNQSPNPTDPTTTTTAPVEEGDVPERDATTCLARYAELVVLMTPLGLDPLTASQWAPRAAEAAELIDAGDHSGGADIICTLVDEMEAEYQVLLGGG